MLFQLGIGLLDSHCGTVKGRRVYVTVPDNSNADSILLIASTKMRCHYVQLRNTKFSLHYSDGTEVFKLRENDEQPFRLDEYRKETGKDYSKLTLYLKVVDSGELVCEFV